jgi:hypothetical protein
VQLPIECCDSPLFERFMDGNTNVARLNHPNAGIWISFFLGLSVPGVSKVYHHMFDSHRLMAIGHMWALRRVSQRPGVRFMEIHWWRRPSGRKELSMGVGRAKRRRCGHGCSWFQILGVFTGWRRFTRRYVGETRGISLLRGKSACITRIMILGTLNKLKGLIL